MSKKIIFVGPPGAGKTTLRKIFFEGESRKELLEIGLEPTHGQETILLNLNETVGVFDLAGQENQRWLETEEKSIFYETKILIIVIDITTTIENLLGFIEKILQIRHEITPNSFIYLLLHKKDLISHDKLIDIKSRIFNKLGTKNLLRIAFTSIKKKYFLETLSLFMDILKMCTSNIIEKEKIDLDLLKNTIDLLCLIEQDKIISETELTKKLKLNAVQIKKIINILASKNYIKISKAQALPLYSLTEEGKKYFIKILRIFTDSNFKIEPNYYEKFIKKKFAPPFLGFMIADKDGKTLNTTEVYDGVFKEYIVPEYERTQADHELIPMFINALEKFAAEINIQNLTDFKLKGTNIKMQTFRYDFFTVTLFMNANTNSKSFKDEIYEWFNTLFKIHEKEFQKSYYSGEVSSLLQIRRQWKKWLVDLNQKYNDLAINLNIFDIRQSVSLYEKLEKISRDFNIKYSIMMQKIKQLKKDLMKAVYEENFHDIRTIAKDLSKLNL